MFNKKKARLRRSTRTRSRIKRLGSYRLCVYRSPRHVYAQIIDEGKAQVVVSASTTERELRGQIKYGGNVAAAQAVGKCLADRAIASGVSRVAFDRSGYKYHGRVKALADAAREGGLQF